MAIAQLAKREWRVLSPCCQAAVVAILQRIPETGSNGNANGKAHSMIIRKLRLEKGWSQETLAEVSGLSVRTIQRIERGGQASLETMNALAAVLETDMKTLKGETDMSAPDLVTKDEAEALEYVRDIKGFYMHFGTYVAVITLLFFIWLIGSASHPWFFWPAFGWGIGVFAHWVSITESLPFFSADWERRQLEKRLGRKRQD